MATNILQKIEAYATDEAFPLLQLSLDILDLVDTKYEDWKSAQKVNTRGDSVALQLPSRFVSDDTLAIGSPDAAGQNYNERRTALAVNKASHQFFSLKNEDLATYDFEGDGSLSVNTEGVIAEIATQVNSDVTEVIANAGYRTLGKGIFDSTLTELPETTNLSYQQTVNNVRQFYNFGGNTAAHIVLPSIAVSEIAGTGLQQFVPDRNDDISRDWSLGTLQGVNKKVQFYSSDLLPTHDAGTAADVSNTGYDIKAINNTETYMLPGTNTSVDASKLTLTVPTGLEIVVNDMLQIENPTGQPDIRFLQFIGHKQSYSRPQARVVVGGTSAANTVEITVIPRLQRTTPATVIDPNDNLTRAIKTTPAADRDLAIFAKSHIRGFALLKNYAKFASPRLPATTPYPSKTVNAQNGGVSMRVYHGYIPQAGVVGMDHAIIYGSLGVPEGIAVIPFSKKLLG